MAQAMLDQMNFSLIQSQSRLEQEQKDMETLLNTFTENIAEDQQDQNSSQDDNVVPKKKMKRRKDYSNTKVKTRNLIKNVSYRRCKQSNFNNLERKLDLEKERDVIKFLWDECIPHDFVHYMYQQVNYNVISKPNVTYQKANEIVKQFIFEDPNRINTLKYKTEERFH